MFTTDETSARGTSPETCAGIRLLACDFWRYLGHRLSIIVGFALFVIAPATEVITLDRRSRARSPSRLVSVRRREPIENFYLDM